MQKKKEVSNIVKHIKNSVVNIKTLQSLGSGFLISENIILTNYHVVGLEVECEIIFCDKKSYNGKVIISYPSIDIAFIYIKSRKKLKPLPLEFSKSYSVGDSVIAYGNPLGFENTVTKGIISAIDREVEGRKFIQTDVAINPGNSGGPLIDRQGKVIGINTMKVIDAQGIGFALPLADIRDIIESVIKSKDKLIHRKYCPICGKTSSNKRKYCKNCGSELKENNIILKKSKKVKCPVCGFKNPSDAYYCQNCGHKLKGE